MISRQYSGPKQNFNGTQQIGEAHFHCLPVKDLNHYAHNLWQDTSKLEELWRKGQLDDVVEIEEGEKELALSQPWRGSPALMVSGGLFSFGADLINEE